MKIYKNILTDKMLNNINNEKWKISKMQLNGTYKFLYFNNTNKICKKYNIIDNFHFSENTKLIIYNNNNVLLYNSYYILKFIPIKIYWYGLLYNNFITWYSIKIYYPLDFITKNIKISKWYFIKKFNNIFMFKINNNQFFFFLNL